MIDSEEDGSATTVSALRQRAEQRLRKEFSDLEEAVQEAAPAVKKLVRELRLHQIELEMQNEELRRSTEALESSQSRYFDLYQLAPVGYLTLDPEGQILEVNLVAAKLLGKMPETLISQSLAKFISPEDGDDYYLRRRELLRTGHLQAFEMRLQGDNGPHSVLVEASLDRDCARNPLVSRVVLIDIAERKRLWSQLLHIQKMEALGVLAGGIAHNFNNALSIVKANSEMILAETAENDPHRDLLSEIQRASERAAKLTRQLLHVGRSDREKVVVFDLNGLVENFVEMLPKVMGVDITITSEVGHEVLQVCAVPSQIELVLMNLALNARDAMPKGGELRIATYHKEGPSAQSAPAKALGLHAVVSVSDTGKGIPLEFRDRIFEQFFTTKEKSEGAGLGLTTAYTIANRSLGFIEVESGVGAGSRFSLFLPMVQADTATAVAEPVRPSLQRTGDTILVVEDEPGVRKITRRILEKEGYTVFTAASGLLGMEVFRSIPGGPSLLLTDVVMPRMSGLRLASLLKEEAPDLRVIFMSGYPDDVLKSEMAPAGAIFLAKPFSRYDLCARVREALEA